MDKSFTGRITKKFKNLLVKEGRDFTSNIFKKKKQQQKCIYIFWKEVLNSLILVVSATRQENMCHMKAFDSV